MSEYTSIPPIERLWARLSMVPGPMDTPCWTTTYRLTGSGYAQFGIGERRVYVHRFTYEYYRGPIPSGLHIDHLCRVRICCNPDHLEAVTAKENIRRGTAPGIIAWRTNTCARGHGLSDAYVRANGKRRCRTCAKQQDRARRSRT